MIKKGVTIPFTKEDVSDLPKCPGVYVFRGDGGEILYVGKAVDLKKRVRSYLSSKAGLSPKTILLTAKAREIEFTVCSSEKEALILEDSLIKSYRPRYNVRLRDDKAYPFICINTGHEYPAIRMVRKRRHNSAIYFGPYTSVQSARETLKFIKKVFGLRSCTDRQFKTTKRPCLKHQIGMCSAPCSGTVSPSEYEKRVKDALDFLDGKTAALVKRLKQSMERASQAMEYEKAARLRDQIAAIERTVEPQDIVFKQPMDLDCIGLSMDEAHGCAVVFVLKVRKGRVCGRSSYEFDLVEGTGREEVLETFLREYRTTSTRELLIPFGLGNRALLQEYLSDLHNMPMKIVVPRQGDKRRLVALAMENARASLEVRRAGHQSWMRLREMLMERLGMEIPPDRVECIDVSHTMGNARYGSLVCFVDGVPWKRGYRLYHLKDTNPHDDYSAINEICSRRFSPKKRKEVPCDLFVIDGGKGQLNQAIMAIYGTGEIPSGSRPFVISIAKGREGGDEKIYLQDKSSPLALPRSDPVLLFIQRIRDEAHRFGISHHRKRLRKDTLTSRLDEVPGIGEKRKRIILDTYSNLNELKTLPPERIAQETGLPLVLCKRLKEGL